MTRHVLATLAYRAGKAVRGAPEGFAEFEPAPGSRPPVRILAHMGDLMEWAWHLARGEKVWNDAEPLPWDEEVARFFAALERLDALIASDEPLAAPLERLFQGPLADALTHVGQITQLRRLAGSPIKGENYFRAEIVAGRVGVDQTPPRREFD
ncbi:MAG TPA: hypothetical protein VLA66_01320, partial [Thermoanaerobaculia bacterium]|nr:hypothetical protein [Thermoanaerobaculia bacterium]